MSQLARDCPTTASHSWISVTIPSQLRCRSLYEETENPTSTSDKLTKSVIAIFYY